MYKKDLQNKICELEKLNVTYKWFFEYLKEEKEELQQRIDKAIEEINYMITNADITEISAIKLKQILGDKENE